MLRTTSVRFDDRNLVSPAGSVPALALAERVGLRESAVEHLWLGQWSIRAAEGWRGGPRRPCRGDRGGAPAGCQLFDDVQASAVLGHQRWLADHWWGGGLV